MSRVELAPWIDILKAVDSVRTPIGLAALTILVLFYLYRTVFSKLRLSEVGHRDVARIVSTSMTLLFWLAITAIVVATLSYVLLQVFDTTEDRLNASISQLKPGQRAESLSAIESLDRLADRTHKFDASICDGLAAFVRATPQWWNEAAFLQDMPSDLQRAVALLSRLNASSRCKALRFLPACSSPTLTAAPWW